MLNQGGEIMSQLLFQNVFTALSEVSEDYQSFESKFITKTHNAKPGLRWDFVNSNVIEKLSVLNIEVAVTQRGAWEMVVIFSKEDNCIFTLMRRSRLEAILINPEKNAPMYLRALTTLNEDLGLGNPVLFEIESDKSGLLFVLNKLCQNLTSNISGQKPNYKIITFDTDRNFRITDYRLFVLDYTCHKLYEESLLVSVKPVYSNEILQVENITEQKPVLKLKKKAEDRIAGQSTVELKDSESNNSKEA